MHSLNTSTAYQLPLKLSKQVTERDQAILQFINQFGFCEIPQVVAYFGLSQRRAYQVIGKLKSMGLVIHERIFYQQHGILRLTPHGAHYTDLPALSRVALANYRHQMSVIQLFLKLRHRYPSAHFVSERHLLHAKYKEGIGQTGHLSDGLLLLNPQKIALEVEIAIKGKVRLEEIIKGYSTQFDIQEVWYFASRAVLPTLHDLAKIHSFLKVYSLDEYLA